MEQGQNITDFFDNEYINFSAYDNYRSIASYIDGLKPTARKTIYTLNKLNITQLVKVENLQSKVSDTTQYLHGAGSIGGVIVNMGQNYIGSNNLPLVLKDGNFGNRLIPVAAAVRYISACKVEYSDHLFNKQDDPILIEQIFEGDIIEPKFYVPVLPIILINGCMNAMTVGFTSHILPRNIKDIVAAIYDILDGKTPKRFFPYFEGFKGIVCSNQEGQVETKGIFSKQGAKEVVVTELPIGISLEKYREILDKLEDKKIIQSYRDLSDTKTDKFKFIIRLTKVIPEDKLYEVLRLIKKETENFTCIDENNRICVFENELEILEAYVKVRLEYYQKRKDYIISELEKELTLLHNRIEFLKLIIGGKIIVFKQKRDKIEEQIVEYKLEKIDDSYDYLLRMPIDSFTEEKLLDIMRKAKTKKAELDTIREKDIKEWWKEEIKAFLVKVK